MKTQVLKTETIGSVGFKGEMKDYSDFLLNNIKPVQDKTIFETDVVGDEHKENENKFTTK